MILPLLIATPYTIIISSCAYGWIKQNRTQVSSPSHITDSDCTLIVACKNEAQNLHTLFQAIDSQTKLPTEIIFINDHSTDSTEQLLAHYCEQHKKATYLNAALNGKKQAIKQAMTHVKTSYVLFTDADCTPSLHWVEELCSVASFQQPDLILAPVIIGPTHSLFQKIQALDFASLIAANAGATRNGNPLYGNAANMMVKTNVWNTLQSQLKYNIPSGDDVFLIHALKAIHGTIYFDKSANATLTTLPVNNGSKLLKQHQRWASKTKYYTDPITIIVALSVMCINVALCSYLLIALFHPSLFISAAILFTLKFIFDSLLMIPFLYQTHQKILLPLWLPLSLIYPIYTTFTALSSLFIKPTWR